MKVTRLSLLAGAALLLAIAPAFAQRVEVQPKVIGGRPGATDAPLLTPDSLEKLKLTAEQKEKYAKIESDFKGKVKDAQDTYRTDIMGINDRTKFRELQEKMQTSTKKAREDHLAKVEPILTGDQKAVFTQVKVQPVLPGGGVRPLPIQIGGGIGQVLPPATQQRLQLTDDQKKEIEKLQKEIEEKIMKVLTDDQKKQLEQLKKGPIRVQPIQPIRPNVRPVQPAVPNVQPVPDVKKD